MTETGMCVRWMIRRDIPEVIALDARHNSPPWVEEVFLRCLRARNCFGMVAEAGWNRPYKSEELYVCGFMVYELHAKHLEVVRFAGGELVVTSPTAFAALVEKLRRKVVRHNREWVRIEVDEKDLGVQLGLRWHGFLCKDVARQDGNLKYVMEWFPTDEDVEKYSKEDY